MRLDQSTGANIAARFERRYCSSGGSGSVAASLRAYSSTARSWSSVSTEPQYPASQVTFEDGKAMFNKQPLNLPYVSFPDRTHEIQAGGSTE